jgi:hypothetical protein
LRANWSRCRSRCFSASTIARLPCFCSRYV